jgi:hypothetical protein
MFEIIENDLTPELIEKYSIPLISKYMIYFDPVTYDILSMTNEKRKDLTNFFEIDFEKVRPFLEGKQDPRQYKVVLNPSNTFELVSKIINQDLKSSVLVPISLSALDSCLNVVHTNSSWKILLSDNEQKRLTNNIVDYVLYIFITSKHNKNFLYRTVTVNLDELIKNGEVIIPFESSLENDLSKIMLSTIKFFESYSLKHE